MNFIRQLTKTLLTASVSRQKLVVSGPRSRGTTPCLALTFDDGPHPEQTPRLLDRLRELGLKATFFVVGKNAETYPGLIQRMVAEGHEVANHTYSHAEPARTSTTSFLAEIRQTDELLCKLTGHIPSTVRPPKGELNWTKLRGLWRQRKTVALWNVDPKDFRMRTEAEMTDWCATYKPRDGDIVLLHDIHPYAVHAVDVMAARGVFERFMTTTIEQWAGRANSFTSVAAKT
jgi:peptidoglycan/xylan/chitin deacetylase (PgdA/CDA1 family)